ncbi:MAG: hypothetical protein EZS28_053489, partial [Streblomastix strix]
ETDILLESSDNQSPQHSFFEFDCESLQETAQKLDIKGFMTHLHYHVTDGQLIGQQLTGIGEKVVVSSNMKEKEAAVASVLNKSTVQQVNKEQFIERVKEQLIHLRTINPKEQV